jgi:ADP-ribosylglycohydrolase
MIGAIAGDIIGSPYEWDNVKRTDFELFTPLTTFTDDTVLTVATANSLLTGISYERSFRELGRRYPLSGFGYLFNRWLVSDTAGPYRSWGNGSAMRVSPVGFAFDSVDDVLREGRKNAEVTHNHPEGIKGAQAVALAVLMARKGSKKKDIKKEIEERFGYDLSRTLDEIRPGYKFEASCQKTVPEAIIAFMESEDFEDAVRKAISLGGDSDTLACITGAIAHAFYGTVPPGILDRVHRLLPRDLLVITRKFCSKYGI